MAVGTPPHRYRGLRNVSARDDFVERGGTELAPMSTTSDIRVAVQYVRRSDHFYDHLAIRRGLLGPSARFT